MCKACGVEIVDKHQWPRTHDTTLHEDTQSQTQHMENSQRHSPFLTKLNALEPSEHAPKDKFFRRPVQLVEITTAPSLNTSFIPKAPKHIGWTSVAIENSFVTEDSILCCCSNATICSDVLCSLHSAKTCLDCPCFQLEQEFWLFCQNLHR